MAIVTVYAPGKVNRRIAGVTFSEGCAEVDTDSAAYQFFRRRGYKVEPSGAAQSDEAGSHDSEQGEEPEQSERDESTEDEGNEPEPDGHDGEQGEEPEQPERPHPVQGSKAVWFEHLSAIKPDHGFDLATVSRKELIAAVEAIESD